jgi:predicted MPP superfamily phosphohydrolase
MLKQSYHIDIPPSYWSSSAKQRRLLLAAGLGGVVLGAYAFLIEPRWLQVTHTRIYLPALPPALIGLRIALLADLHVGRGTPLSLIRRACQKAMAEHPDLIALSGDFVSDDIDSFGGVLKALACLDAPLGVYAVPGNHDHRADIKEWHRQFAADSKIIDLTNQAVIRVINGSRLCIAGVDDFSHGTPRLQQLPSPDQVDCTILLAHNPDQAEHLRGAHARVDLVLSGHTHGGQIRLPLIGALRNPARHDDLYEEGLHQRPWTQVYVSRGIGTTHLPVRFLCRPEVAILELTGPSR